MAKALGIHIKGIVQGVGYRPFVYSLAAELGIKGWVNNSSDGLYIHAEGKEIEVFYTKLLQEKPLLANIIFIEKKKATYQNFLDFKIVQSQETDEKDVLISPDVATCQDCIKEMLDPHDRRTRYPFINCTNCGPRYSIISDRPYDRRNTTMTDFEMCGECCEEYTNPLDRRFHAQPVACEKCGPRLQLINREGQEIVGEEIEIRLLEQGSILAVKGIGGYHLVCDASNQESVNRLRRLKERGAKPLAIMAKDIEKVRAAVRLTEIEKNVLTSPAAPIVLLPKKPDISDKIAPGAAPGLHTLGMMLPYTPVHHLLFQGKYDYLVMTSANLSGQPLIYQNEQALAGLNGIADYFLIHDREIFHPVDDSVVQVIGGELTFIRRARGYVPFPILLKKEISGSIVGLGGEMKNSFCLASGKMAYMSQYIGDMHGYENLDRWQQEYRTYQKVANIFPRKAAYDLHPEYSTTRMAREMNCPKLKVQHHHAHHVSVMVEQGLTDPMLGLICDGTGYGQDGKLWGFEYLDGNEEGYVRKGHLEYLPLPGGDAGAKHPLRIAYAYLKKVSTTEEWNLMEPIWSKLPLQERKILDSQLKSGFQVFETSSAGRLFDAISGLLGICTEVTYEGQAAVELESRAVIQLEKWIGSENSLVSQNNVPDHDQTFYTMHQKTGYFSSALQRVRNTQKLLEKYKRSALKGEDNAIRDHAISELIKEYNWEVNNDHQALDHNKEKLYSFNLESSANVIFLRVQYFFKGILADYLSAASIGEIALRFHYSLACAMLETAMVIGIKEQKLIVGGGVFHNKLLTEILLALAHEIGIEIIYPKNLPAGDGGLALGQVMIANHALR